ncbi:MAG: cellulase family glycosylhydrolase [Spirochaetota bacterium]
MALAKRDSLGINLVLKHQQTEQIKKYIEKLKKLGVAWVRLEFNFFEEVDDGILDFTIAELEKEQIQILGLLTGLVPGNIVNSIMPSLNFQNPLDSGIGGYLQFCRKYVEKYKSRITHWEVWNEQNTIRFWIRKPDAKEYMQLLQETVPIIRGVDPNNRVVMGAIMGDDIHKFAPFQEMYFVRQCLDLGIDEWVDIYNFHPYVPSCYVSLQAKDYYIPAIQETMQNFRAEYKDITKEIWITEFGICPKWVKVTETEIGEIYQELLLHCESLGMKFFLWVLTDFPRSQDYSWANPELYFGLLDVDLQEKELYQSFYKSLQA